MLNNGGKCFEETVLRIIRLEELGTKSNPHPEGLFIFTLTAYLWVLFGLTIIRQCIYLRSKCIFSDCLQL